MTVPFQIVIDGWLQGDSGSPEVQATVAEIGITVGGHCATEVEDLLARSTRKTVRVSAMLLAAWLLDNWWRLRWEPFRQAERNRTAALDWELSHSFESVGGGYVWPPLTIASDGENILFRCVTSEPSEYPDISPIRYLNSFSEAVAATEFEQKVGAFVEMVISRLDSSGHRKSVLHDLWKETLSERGHSSRGFVRRLEASLGLDPDQNPGLVSSLKKHWGPLIGNDALREIAVASDPNSIENALSAANAALAVTKSFADTSGIESLRASLHHAWSSKTTWPWAFARDAANKLRELWGVESRVLTTSEMADRLQLQVHVLNEFHTDVPFALVSKVQTRTKSNLS